MSCMDGTLSRITTKNTDQDQVKQNHIKSSPCRGICSKYGDEDPFSEIHSSTKVRRIHCKKKDHPKGSLFYGCFSDPIRG